MSRWDSIPDFAIPSDILAEKKRAEFHKNAYEREHRLRHSMEDNIAELSAERDRYREALKKYGRHLSRLRAENIVMHEIDEKIAAEVGRLRGELKVQTLKAEAFRDDDSAAPAAPGTGEGLAGAAGVGGEVERLRKALREASEELDEAGCQVAASRAHRAAVAQPQRSEP